MIPLISTFLSASIFWTIIPEFGDILSMDHSFSKLNFHHVPNQISLQKIAASLVGNEHTKP
jgi:hypothetical protein